MKNIKIVIPIKTENLDRNDIAFYMYLNYLIVLEHENKFYHSYWQLSRKNKCIVYIYENSCKLHIFNSDPLKWLENNFKICVSFS